MKNRNFLLLLFTLIVLIAANGLIIQKEYLKANSQVILLELAPVDPRSLIQGDYMRLRYVISREVEDTNIARDGHIVVRLDKNNVAHYVRIYDPQTPLVQDELLLRYRQRKYDVNIGPESFFFQEGHAKYYDNAHYGEIRVSNGGDVLLVGLRGDKFEQLGPPSP